MNNKLITLATCSFLLLSGCAKQATTTEEIDNQLYSNASILDEVTATRKDVNVDLRKIRFVYLETKTTFYPGRFDFYVRKNLSKMGLKVVLNKEELTALILNNPELSNLSSINDPVSQSRLSTLIGPILKIRVTLGLPNGANRSVSVEITDLSSGRRLLELSHNTLVWANFETEVFFPVFKVMNEWLNEVRALRGSEA
ncbi:MAG: hypothetical protein K9M17_06965 [Mariprofundaceae bacterium]|nr:hypothetical protein [Mariprofundaceae bacterium]